MGAICLRFIKSSSIGVILLALFAPVVLAEKVVRLGVYEIDYAPYQVLHGTAANGPDRDYIDEIFARLPAYRVQRVLLPLRRALDDIRRGNIDLLPMFFSESRSEFALITEHALHVSHYRIAVWQGKEFPFSKISDLYPYRIGVVISNRIGREFDRAAEDGRIETHQNNSWITQLHLLKSGRVDAVAGNMEILSITAAKLGYGDSIVYLPHPVSPVRGMRLGVSKRSKNVDALSLLRDLNRTMKALCEDGSFDRIWRQNDLDPAVQNCHAVADGDF